MWCLDGTAMNTFQECQKFVRSATAASTIEGRGSVDPHVDATLVHASVEEKVTWIIAPDHTPIEHGNAVRALEKQCRYCRSMGINCYYLHKIRPSTVIE